MVASYKEIKENPKQWVLHSPTSARRNDHGIISSFFEFKTAIRNQSNELRFVKIYRKSEQTEETIKLIKKEIQFFKQLDHPNITKLIEVLEDE